jgi:O-methyltransferase
MADLMDMSIWGTQNIERASRFAALTLWEGTAMRRDTGRLVTASLAGAVKLRPLGVLARIVNSILGVFGLYIARSSSTSAWWAHERTPELRHSRLYVGTTYSPWLSDAEFLSAYEIVKKFTLVDRERCYELWDFAKQSVKINGAIIEVGVWRGGTGCLLAMSAPTKSVYLADTFQGVVKAGKNDIRYKGGEHADTSVQMVTRLLSLAQVDNVRLLNGIFPDETAAGLEGPISLLHVDVDTYQSAKDIVEWALPRLPVGAKIVFDDYGFYESGGITRLVNELRESLGSFDFVYNLNGHAILIRTRMP